MDSRQLYIANDHLLTKINWHKEWIHFDTGAATKFELLNNLIYQHLNSDEILFIYTRTDSSEYKRDQIIDRIKPLLGKGNFVLWNKFMDKVILFNKIGVLQMGQI